MCSKLLWYMSPQGKENKNSIAKKQSACLPVEIGYFLFQGTLKRNTIGLVGSWGIKNKQKKGKHLVGRVGEIGEEDENCFSRG